MSASPMMHKEDFLTNIKCITKTMHGFTGRLHPKWKRSVLRSTFSSMVWMEGNEAGVQTPLWSMFTEKVSVPSHDRPVPGNACASRFPLTQLLAKQTHRCYRRIKADPPSISLRINHKPHGPWVSPLSVKSRGLLLGTTNRDSLRKRCVRWDNIIYAFGQSSCPVQGMTAPFFKRQQQ